MNRACDMAHLGVKVFIIILIYNEIQTISKISPLPQSAALTRIRSKTLPDRIYIHTSMVDVSGTGVVFSPGCHKPSGLISISHIPVGMASLR